MAMHRRAANLSGFAGILAIALCGCAGMHAQQSLAIIESSPVPRELDKAALPAYVVEPPDILLIEALHNIRPPSSLLRAGDQLGVQLKNGLPFDPGVDPETNPLQYQAELAAEIEFKTVKGNYLIGSDGRIDLGPAYGKVAVAGLTVDQSEVAIKQYLETVVGLKAPELSVVLPDVSGPQAITGEHLIRPDGTVSLGIYGEVFVAGMSLPEVKAAVEHQLSRSIHQPEVTVDVLAYNSKVFYIISDGGGFGEQVVRLPCTGNETVLDAIAQVQGLSEVSSKKIWIARPAPAGTGVAQVLEVSWDDITALGQTATNYQILPGDRIYIQADKLIAADNFLAKLFAPFERIFGVVALGTGTARTIEFYNQQGGGFGGGGGGF